MRSSMWKSGRVLIAAALVSVSVVAAAAAQTDPAHDAMMAEMMKAAAPGPQHQAMVKSMAGTWKTSMKSWMGPEPVTTAGKSVMTPILGGRFVHEQHTGTMFGGPFEGVGIYGYDNARKSYVSMWTDNMSTGIMLSTGSMDPSGKVLTLHGSYLDPTTGKEQTMRLVSKTVDDKTRVLEMYGDSEGKEIKMSEITYTRM